MLRSKGAHLAARYTFKTMEMGFQKVMLWKSKGARWFLKGVNELKVPFGTLWKVQVCMVIHVFLNIMEMLQGVSPSYFHIAGN